jgi:putative FmdB family regulatory protein
MPVYEYKCSSCGTTYDVFHRGREVTSDVVCPACNSGQYKKLMSAAAVSMKQSAPSRGACDAGPCDNGGCCGGSCAVN